MGKPRVVLLFGMPRSGTTWIGKVFDSHNMTLYRHEPDTWEKIHEIPFLEDANNYDMYGEFVGRYIENLFFNRMPQVNGKLPLFNKNYASSYRNLFFKLSVYFSSMINQINQQKLLPIIPLISKPRTNDAIIVWKSIQLLGRLGVIAKCIEQCVVVHILRHPCGYISSVLNGESIRKFSSVTAASEDYNLFEKILEIPQAEYYGLTIETLKTLTPVERLTWRWVLFNEKAIDDLKNFSNRKIVRYEDACIKPMETFKELFQFCNFTWCDQTEKFILSSTSKDNNSYYSVYKDPKISAFKWKQNLTKNSIQSVRDIVMSSRMSSYYQDMF